MIVYDVETKNPTFAPTPRSNAIDGYELLRDVRDAVRAEPLRLNQNDWIQTFAHRPSWISDKESRPACGTVACVAGWAIVLRRERNDAGVHGASERALGLFLGEAPPAEDETTWDAWREARRAILKVFYLFPNVDGGPKIGTPEYVNAVVERINGVLEEHGDALRRHTLPALT